MALLLSVEFYSSSSVAKKQSCSVGQASNHGRRRVVAVAAAVAVAAVAYLLQLHTHTHSRAKVQR